MSSSDGLAAVHVWFSCVLQPRNDDPSRSRGIVLQLQGKPTVVTVEGVPEKDLDNGIPRSSVLWQAETMFLDRQGHFYPDHHVIAWEARLNDARGQVLSRFQVVLPATDD